MPAVKLPDAVMALKPIPIRLLKNMCHFGPKSNEIKDGRAMLASLGFENDPDEAWRQLYDHEKAGNIEIIDHISIPERPMSNEDRLDEVEELHNRVCDAEAERDDAFRQLEQERQGRESDRQRIAALEAKIDQIIGGFGNPNMSSQSVKTAAPLPTKEPVADRFAAAKKKGRPKVSTVTPKPLRPIPAPSPGCAEAVQSDKTTVAADAEYERTLEGASKAPLGGTGEREIISARPKQQVLGELPPLVKQG